MGPAVKTGHCRGKLGGRKRALHVGNLLQTVQSTLTRAQRSHRNPIHMRILTDTSTITHAELQWACWDISDDIEAQTKPHGQSRVCGRKHMRQQGWAEAVKDTGKEVKAAAERGVSLSPGKKTHTGGEAQGEKDGVDKAEHEGEN